MLGRASAAGELCSGRPPRGSPLENAGAPWLLVAECVFCPTRCGRQIRPNRDKAAGLMASGLASLRVRFVVD